MMKNGKKAISVLLAGFTLSAAALIGGCGGGGGDKSIVYYMWGSSKEVKAAEQLAADFEVLHPGWHVDVQSSSGSYYDNLKTYFGGGNAPDVFFMEGGMIESFLKDGLLLDLEPYLKAGGAFTEENLWDVNDYYRYDASARRMGSGDLYAVIKDLTPDFMMIYNKKHIDEYNASHETSLAQEVGYPAGTGADAPYPSESTAMTWEQCTKMCRLLTKTNANGDITRYGTTLDQVPWKHVMEWIQMGGDTLFTEDMRELNVSSQAVTDAFEYFIAFQSGETKSAAPVASNSVGGGEGFRNGDISVVWNGRWAWQSYGWYDVNFEIGVAPPPTPKGGEDVYCSTVMTAQAISSTTKHPEVAWAFLEYYMTAGMREYVQTGYNIPGNKTIAYGDFLNVDDAYQKNLNSYFIGFIEKAQPIEYSFYIDQGRVEGILGDYIPRVWTANAKDRLTLSQALEQAAKEIRSVTSIAK